MDFPQRTEPLLLLLPQGLAGLVRLPPLARPSQVAQGFDPGEPQLPRFRWQEDFLVLRQFEPRKPHG